MEIPLICTQQNDLVLHVLFNNNIEFIRNHIRAAMENLHRRGVSSEALDAMRGLATAGSITVVRAIFFLLLHVDEHSREAVSRGGGAWQVCAMDPYKAARFFTYLESVIHRWIQDERESTHSFVNNIEHEYINS